MDYESFLRHVLVKESSPGFGPHVKQVLYTPRAANEKSRTARTPLRMEVRVTGKIGQSAVRPRHTARA